MKWKRFTIRGVLVAVTIIALFFAYVSGVISGLKPQSRHFHEIFRKYHAAVTYTPIEQHKWLHPFLALELDTEINSVIFFEKQHNGETLSTLIPHMNAFNSCDTLSIQQNATITDDDLRDLALLDNLETLEIQGGNFTDACPEHLFELQNLNTLVISKTKITPNGLKILRQFLPHCGINADIPVPPLKPAENA